MSSEENHPNLSNGGGASGAQNLHRILKPGESFGNYTVVRCISAGLLANYYHMQHTRSLEDVSVGVFHARTADDPKFLKRLRALEKAMSSFDRDGIPRIKDCAQINNLHCIIMEPVQGISLNRYFATHGQPGKTGIGPEDTSDILARLLGLLGYAHVKGVDHRDMDSDLILVREDGGLQLLGLGVKAAMGRELFESIVSASVSPLVSTKTVGRLNSFDMISPEYREGKAEDFKVDLCSVGMIGYWLLTAKKANLSQVELPTTFMPQLPPEWDDFFRKTLQRIPENRYASCKVALVGLKKIYSDEPDDSRRVGLIQRQIDRIPVPKSIAARGALATRIYRLSLIGLVGVTLTALASFAFVEAFNEPGEYRKLVAAKVEDDQQPDLLMTISPQVAKVTFKNTDSKFITTSGRLELLVQPGRHELEISSPNHLSRKLTVQIKRGVVDYQRVSLRPKWSDLRIVATPETTVFAINKDGERSQLGVTDFEGNLNLETGVFSGSYTLIFEKPGYESMTLENQVLSFGEQTEIRADLTALPGSLTVLTEPAGAVVFVGGVELGVTPLRIENLKMAQTYSVRVALPGYRSVTRDVEIDAGEAHVLELGTLDRQSGQLRFELSITGDAERTVEPLLDAMQVELDGELIPYGDTRLNRILVGEHSVRLIHPAFASEIVDFEIKDGETTALDMTLGQLPGVVHFELESDLNSVVYVDGEPVKLMHNKLPISSERVVEIEVRTPNHLSVLRRFELQPKEEVTWAVVPERIPGPELNENWIVPYLGLSMVWVEPGEFLWGSPKEEHGRIANEGPLTEVRLTYGFWAGVYEITQNQYRSVMHANPSKFRDGRHPVDSVTWESAKEFCQKLTRIEAAAGRLPEGLEYRLPTEAEWEYLARAGSVTPFHFGNKANASNANFKGVYPRERFENLEATDVYGSTVVGKYEPNAWGIYDVHGNVQEWTMDRFNGRLPGDSIVDPEPNADGPRVAVRGGSWQDSAVWARSAARRELRPERGDSGTGFRVVLAPIR